MDNANKIDLRELIRKPAVMIGGAVLFLIIMATLIFGRGEAVDNKAVEVKNLVNMHGATIEVIEKYSKNVRSANLKANLSEANIILTANKSEIEDYYKEYFKNSKNVVATFKEKPKKEITDKLEEGIVSNNLDRVLQEVTNDQLDGIIEKLQAAKSNNPEKKKLGVMVDKLKINVQTILVKINEPL